MTILGVVAGQVKAGIAKRPVPSLLIVVGVVIGTGFVAWTSVGSSLPAASGDEAGEAARLQWFSIVATLMTVVGVGNAMAISVAERAREIGTLKCLGASNSMVALIYFAEALVLGLAGSIIGSTLGSALAIGPHLLNGYGRPLLVPTIVGVSVSAVSALIPAWVVARMDAIAALRKEV